MAFKNAANTLRFFVQDTATGLGVAGLTVGGGGFTTIKLSQGGTLSADIKGDITLVAEATGWYNFAATAAYMNYTEIAPVVAPATATYQAYGVTVYTEATGDSFARLGAPAGASIAADILRLISGLVPTTGTVNDAGASTTVFITDLASSVNDFYKGMALVFTSGALAGQLGQIKTYNGSTKAVTLQSALTSAPVNGVAFSIVSAAASRKLADFLATAMGTDNKMLVSTDVVTPANVTQIGGTANASATLQLKAVEIVNNTGTAVLIQTTEDMGSHGLRVVGGALGAGLKAEGGIGQGGINGLLVGHGIWDTLTSALSTVNSIGKKLADWVLGTDSMVKISADAHVSGVKTDLLDELKHRSGSSGYNRDTDSLQGIGYNAGAIVAKFVGITLLAKWLRGFYRKDAMDATAKSEVNTGGGTFNEATDSAEAIADAMAKDTTVAKASALAVVATELAKVKGATAGKCIISADGQTVQKYDEAGNLLVTLVRTGSGPYTWTPTWE